MIVESVKSEIISYYNHLKNLSGFINGDKSLNYRDEENIRQFNGILILKNNIYVTKYY